MLRNLLRVDHMTPRMLLVIRQQVDLRLQLFVNLLNAILIDRLCRHSKSIHRRGVPYRELPFWEMFFRLPFCTVKKKQ